MLKIEALSEPSKHRAKKKGKGVTATSEIMVPSDYNSFKKC